MTTWHENLGVISIGCQNGAPHDGGLGDMKVRLWQSLLKHCRATYCPTVDHFALVLRIDGAFQKFGEESIKRIRRTRRDRTIGADIVIPEIVWRNKTRRELGDYLVRRVREALELCVARLQKDKEIVDVR